MMYERKSYPDFKFHVNGVIYLSKSFVLWNRKFYQYDHSHPLYNELRIKTVSGIETTGISKAYGSS